MADLQRLCIDGNCSTVPEYTAGENVTISNNVISATDTKYDDATQSASGLMSGADKTKLDGITAGAQPNQNAFSNVQVGNTTVAADSVTDTLTLAAGTNVTLTPNASADSVTIAVPDVYTKAQVDDLLDALNTGLFEVVQTLPSTGSDKVIYLVPKSGSAPDVYDEYIYVNNAFEKIGTTSIDLSNYYTKTQTDNLLADKQDKLTAGSNVQISGNVISATDTKYTAGTNVQISSSNVISATDTKYDPATATPKMDGTGTVGTSVKYAREDHIHPKDTSKQDKLTAGDNITISGTTISATDTTNNFYATSTTAAATASKTASVAGSESFILKPGVIVGVMSSATNTAENPTLNVNGTGAKPIYYNNAVVTASNLWAAGYANRVQYYMYDGTNWVWAGHSLDNNTTYTNMTQAEATTGTATSARAISAKVLNDTIDAKVKDYTGTAPITVSGTTISHDNSGITAKNYGTNSDTALTPAFGDTFYVPGFHVTAKGHVDTASHHTVKIPNTAATQSAAGLMSAADKTKLDGITTGASVTGVKGNAETNYRTGNVNLTPQNIAWLGDNPTGGLENDTRAFWQGLGTGYCRLTQANMTNGQPYTYGFVISIVYSTWIHQEFWRNTSANGNYEYMYHREAATATTDMPEWMPVNTDTKYTAGTNVQISSSNVISATDTQYGATSPIVLRNGAFGHAETGVDTITHGETTNVSSPMFGDSFFSVYAKANVYGHLETLGHVNVTFPDYTATQSLKGLMSKEDKQRLDDIYTVETFVAEHSTSGKIFYFHRMGPLVVLESSKDINNVPAGYSNMVQWQIPERFRPVRMVRFGVENQLSDGTTTPMFIEISAGGYIQFYTPTTITQPTNCTIEGTYVTTDGTTVAAKGVNLNEIKE